MPWERLQEGPEEPLTDDLDADILIADGRLRHHPPPWIDYCCGQKFLRQFMASKHRYWILLLIATILFSILVPIILVIQNQKTRQTPPGNFQHPLVSDTSTPFMEPFEAENTSDSIRSFDPGEASFVTFFYDYFSLLASVENTNSTTNQSATPEITIFYEALSIPSRVFLAHQFFPTYFETATPPRKFSAKLVPFGHAQFLPKDEKGVEKLQCEHNQDECQGNLVQACGIRHTKWNDTESVDNLMRFIKCVMADTGKGGNILVTAPDATGSDCAKMVGFNWDTIYNCAVGREGFLILRNFQQKTDAVLKMGGRNVTDYALPVVVLKGYGVLSETDKSDFSHFIQTRLETTAP